MAKMALTAVGRDRPGIVAEVSRVLYQHGCNLEDSSMTILEGEFAMILIVEVPSQASLEGLRRDLDAVAADMHLLLALRELPEPVAERAPAGRPFILSVYGADRPGIVYEVTRLLADQGINITDVNTRVVSGARPVYIMLLEIEVPGHISPDELSRQLSDLGARLQVEITFRPLETAQL
jgi:glycine cleavage system transcriptional repressor